LSVIGHREEPDLPSVDGVQQAEGEAPQGLSANELSKQWCSPRILDDGPESRFDFSEKRDPQSREAFLVVRNRLRELGFR